MKSPTISIVCAAFILSSCHSHKNNLDANSTSHRKVSRIESGQSDLSRILVSRLSADIDSAVLTIIPTPPDSAPVGERIVLSSHGIRIRGHHAESATCSRSDNTTTSFEDEHQKSEHKVAETKSRTTGWIARLCAFISGLIAGIILRVSFRGIRLPK